MLSDKIQILLDKQDKMFDPMTAAVLISAGVSAGTAIYQAKNQPKMPKAPKQPDQIVGIESQVQGTKTLEEDQVQKQSARQTARKGAAAYRIPLEAKSTGVKTGGGTGLNI